VDEVSRLAAPLTEAAKIALEQQPTTDVWPQCAALPCATTDGAAQHLRFHQDLLRLARLRDLQGLQVLDVGSGFGMTLVTCVLMGAREAHGIEYVPGVVEAVERYLGSLPDGLRTRIHNRQGDAAELPYPDRSFDVLLSLEAISHYLDVDGFLDEAARVLRPNGLLLIADGNNGANRRVVKETHEIWQAFEQAEPGTVTGTHTVERSYRDARRDVIAAAHPNINAEDLDALARNTAGFTSEQALAAADRFVRDGVTPDSPYREGTLAVSPSGIVMERLFVPRELAASITARGFSAKAWGYWGGASGRPSVRLVNRMLQAASPLTISTAPSFRIVARRKSS
jgi:SAM-dependent methyltransferase